VREDERRGRPEGRTEGGRDLSQMREKGEREGRGREQEGINFQVPFNFHEQSTGGTISFYHSWGCALSLVEVDLLTGTWEVKYFKFQKRQN
jgi:hypothetical protein